MRQMIILNERLLSLNFISTSKDTTHRSEKQWTELPQR